MDTWLQLLMILFVTMACIMLIFWLDWIFKCRKSAKDNKLETYLVCYWLAKNEASKDEVMITNGILGLSTNDIIFAHRFKDEFMYMEQEISNIVQVDILNFSEEELLDFVHRDLAKTDEVRYTIVNMAGYSSSKRIPKFIKARKLCKIRLANGDELYFYYKNTLKNTEIMKKLFKI